MSPPMETQPGAGAVMSTTSQPPPQPRTRQVTGEGRPAVATRARTPSRLHGSRGTALVGTAPVDVVDRTASGVAEGCGGGPGARVAEEVGVDTGA